jgi:hypothetical protein
MTVGLAIAVEPGGPSRTLAPTGTITLGPDGLRCEGVPPLAEFERVGTMLQQAHHMLAWWIGDWFNAGEAYHGETFAQLLDHAALDPSTVVQYARIARQVPHDRRTTALSFSHHREVADLDPDQQYVWLSRADDAGWSSHRLRRELAKSTRAEARLWVLVEAKSPEDAEALRDRLIAEGRAAKVIER